MLKFFHPYSGAYVKGYPVKLGSLIKEGDIFPSVDGTWKNCPSPGTPHQKYQNIIVRPVPG
jgi:hypothetical protein